MSEQVTDHSSPDPSDHDHDDDHSHDHSHDHDHDPDHDHDLSHNVNINCNPNSNLYRDRNRCSHHNHSIDDHSHSCDYYTRTYTHGIYNIVGSNYAVVDYRYRPNRRHNLSERYHSAAYQLDSCKQCIGRHANLDNSHRGCLFHPRVHH